MIESPVPTSVPLQDPLNHRSTLPEPPVALSVIEETPPGQKFESLDDAEVGATALGRMIAETIAVAGMVHGPAAGCAMSTSVTPCDAMSPGPGVYNGLRLDALSKIPSPAVVQSTVPEWAAVPDSARIPLAQMM